MEFILILGGALLVAFLLSKLSRKSGMINDLMEERNVALNRMEAVKAEKEKLERENVTPAKENDDKKFWAGIYRNGTIKTVRVSEYVFKKMLADAEFLVNASGSYANVKGLYRGQKVMMKLPRKVKVNANSDSKTN